MAALRSMTEWTRTGGRGRNLLPIRVRGARRAMTSQSTRDTPPVLVSFRLVDAPVEVAGHLCGMLALRLQSGDFSAAICNVRLSRRQPERPFAERGRRERPRSDLDSNDAKEVELRPTRINRPIIGLFTGLVVYA
jgi:hypothetical protein